MTLSETVNYINKALNYPAVTIADLDLYFNQAFSEINTQLHLSLPSLEDMRKQAEEGSSVNYRPVKEGFAAPSSIDDLPVDYDPETDTNVYFNALTNKFTYKGETYTKVYYVYFDENSQKEMWYETRVIVGNPSSAAWFRFYMQPTELNLEDYLPKDWIFLFLIPYVCFKRSVLDGDQGVLFNNEMASGFNQLRDSYSIPEKVLLKDVIHLPAYRDYAKALEDSVVNWYQWVPTRAIYDKYKIPKAVGAISHDFYDKGGWGL